MNKKLLTLLCAGGIIAGSTVFAQENDMPPPPPPGHELDHPLRHTGPDEKGPGFDHEFHKKMADKFAADLGLTEEQKKEADKIRESGREKMKPLMDEMKMLRGKMDQLREENMKEFENILTPEQKTKLEQMKKDRKDAFEKRKADRKMRRKHMRPGHVRPEHHERPADHMPEHE